MEFSENKTSNLTLCLNMIVKNESKIIKRLLQSVLPIIDTYCICDTGSTDNTIEIIQQFFDTYNIKGKIVKEPFKDFAYNRNFALQSCIGMSDYILLLDADMILNVYNFSKKMLSNADHFCILQGSNEFYYQNTRIIKNDARYKYIGVTHEYISTPSDNRAGQCFSKNQLFITDIGDGGSKTDKFERDIRLLTEGIINEPENAIRYYFYLANSYLDNGNPEQAIKCYQKRIEMGGWQQEVWYSYYRIGIAYKNMGKMADAINSWLEAYQYFPKRIENLYEMICYYRIHSKHNLAKIFYDIAQNTLKTITDKDSYLFLQNNIYTYKLDYEYTIFSAYLGVKNVNNEVVHIFNTCKENSIIQNLFSNMKFYKDILIPNNVLHLTCEINKNINNTDTKLYSSSICIIPNKNKDGYLLNQRFVNFYIDNEGNYLNCYKHIITGNKYIEMDSNFCIKNEKFFNVENIDRRYIGVEDVRIFQDKYNNKLLFTGTGFHSNNSIGVVVGDYNINHDYLVPTEIIPDFANNSCEKNWLYLDYKDDIHMIYNWYPLQICKINYDTNKLQLVEKRNMPSIFTHARGSAGGFKYVKKYNFSVINADENINIEISENKGIEYWFVVHYVSYERPRHYYHSFVVFDENMNLLRYSAPLKFQNECIEYCLGIVVEDNRVIATYSSMDRTTSIACYDKKYIESKLVYKP